MPRTAAVLVALWTVLTPAYSFAADDPPEPQRPGWVKRTVHTFLADEETGGGRSGVHRGPFFPRIDVVSSGSGPGPMLHFWARDIGGTPLDVHASASYSTYKYQYYDLQVGLVPHQGERLPSVERGTSALFPLADLERTAAVPGLNIYAAARYRDYPREDFYGVGPNSGLLYRTDYLLQDGLYEGIVRFRVAQLSLMGRAGLLQTSIGPGTDSVVPSTELSNDEGTAPGLLRAPDFVHLWAAPGSSCATSPATPIAASLSASPSRASTTAMATPSSSTAPASTPESTSPSVRTGTSSP